MLIKKEQLNQQPIHQYNKKQQSLLAKSSLIAAIGFLLITGIGYALYYGLINNKIDPTVLYSVSGISFFILLITMIISSFNRSIWLRLFVVYPFYILSASIGFSSLFIVFEKAELLMIFGISGISMALCALFGLILPTKMVGSLMKFASMLMFICMIASLIFIFVSIFSFNHFNNSWWSMIIVILIGFFSIAYNIYIFHVISKTNEFHQELNNQQTWFFAIEYGFALLVSLIQLIWTIAYVYLAFK